MNRILDDKGRGRWKGLLLSALLLFASCDKTQEGLSVDPDRVTVDFSTAISSGVETKTAPVTGKVFPARSENYPIGLWICEPEDIPTDFAPVETGYDNIEASLAVNAATGDTNEESWTYYFNNATHNTLSVRRGTSAKVYAYHPYVEKTDENSLDPTKIPFTSGQDDWMWATPADLSATDNASVTVPLAFHHAMTCLHVKLKCQYNGTVRLTSMKLVDTKGKRLGVSGIMDATDGTLSSISLSDTITISPDVSLSTSLEQDFCIIMPEPTLESLADGDFILKFQFNGVDAIDTFPIPTTMTSTTDASSKVTITGFETGKRYIYHLTLNNVMRFADITSEVDYEWSSAEIDFEL